MVMADIEMRAYLMNVLKDLEKLTDEAYSMSSGELVVMAIVALAEARRQDLELLVLASEQIQHTTMVAKEAHDMAIELKEGKNHASLH